MEMNCCDCLEGGFFVFQEHTLHTRAPSEMKPGSVKAHLHFDNFPSGGNDIK